MLYFTTCSLESCGWSGIQKRDGGIVLEGCILLEILIGEKGSSQTWAKFTGDKTPVNLGGVVCVSLWTGPENAGGQEHS